MKMKRILLSTMFSLLFAIGSFAQTSGFCGGDGTNLTWSLSDSVLTISGTGNMANYELNSNKTPWWNYIRYIKGVIIDNGVTSIGNNAFRDCSSLLSITIPDGVTFIGHSTFSGCSSLTSVTIPDGVTFIEAATFYGCSSLTNIAIPDGVTSIGVNAFSGCSSLTSITIPDGVTSIGVNAFRGCSSLISITIPDGVARIEQYVFRECNSLTSIIIPESVLTIRHSAFLDCSSLTSVTIPESVASIWDDAFSGCSSLTSITIPDGVTYMGSRVFANCTNLTSITIGNGIISIRDDVFANCTNLTNVVIGNGMHIITSNIFSHCPNLTSITIGTGVTAISFYVFIHCPNLATVTVNWEVPISINSLSPSMIPDLFPSFSNITLVVPTGTKALYERANYWKEFGVVVEVGTEIAPVQSVSILTDVSVLTAGDILPVSAVITPADATNKNIAWTSDNTDVATIDQNGKVTALSAGTTIITAKANGGKTDTLNITVSNVVETSVTLDITTGSIPIGNTLQVTATVTPSNTSLIWTSNNEDAATVDQMGKITAISRGVATITAMTANGVSASCHVRVYAEEVKMNDVTIDQPIDGDNSIIFALQLPVDGSATGSFAVKLPVGMVIDLENTTLSESLAKGLELVMTPLVDNTWLIKIVYPSTLSMQLRSASTFRQLVNIAYKVDESMAAGTYEVVLSDIEIRLSDGTNIVKDRMSTNVTVSSDITANEFASGTTAVTLSNGMLTVDTPNAETVKVFSVGGTLVSAFTKSEGRATFTPNLPNGIYIVTGSAGWSVKVVVY